MADIPVKILVVAGGGGGASGGAGGGGVIVNDTFTITNTSLAVTVGTGGAGKFVTGTGKGDNGLNSVFSGQTAVGGGGGGNIGGADQTGANGGSGGGGGASGAGTTLGGTGTSGQGKNGKGNAGFSDPYPAGGGGGGAADGLPAQSVRVSGDGGAGKSSTIYDGTTRYYGGGGGGCNYFGTGTQGAGGVGGGGSGIVAGGQAGTDALGGGGGGAGNVGGVGSGGKGGKGVVIISYLASYGTATGGTVTDNGSYKVHTFTTSGTFDASSLVVLVNPTVTDCSPASGTATGGTAVTLTGTGFVTGATVKFDTTAATSVSVVSATSITCVTPAHAAGAVDIVVTNTDTGTATLTGGFTYISLASTLTNVSPASSATQGGGIMTITGTGFTATGVIYIDGLAVTTTYISATILQCVIPAHAAGGVTIQVIDGASVLTWTYSFIYIVGAPEDYTILINGKDVSGVQIKRFTQKNEINFIDRTNLSFNNIEITAPFNIINLFYKDNNNDIVTVKRNAVALFKGYISAKEKDYSTQIYYITASQLLSLTGKTNSALADASASAPVARMVKLLTDYLPVEYIAPQATGLDSYFAGISILLNTGTSDTKLLDVILSICELLDLAIFIDDNLIIKIIPLPLAFSNGKDITEALASLPVIKEKKEYYYNAVSLKYYATVGGADATATAGSGDLALNLSFSNIYFDAASAALIAARKLALRNKIYFEAEFTVNKTVVLNIGDSFAFDIYNFIVIYKEETLTSFKIIGLGAEK